uniref:Uncharacterized protein n=1 Tax=Romanomermis culicivorax TaxID=13658 RepID=A0A915J3P3_ROMCU
MALDQGLLRGQRGLVTKTLDFTYKSAATRPFIYNNICIIIFVEYFTKIQRPSSGQIFDVLQRRERREKLA